MSEHLGATILPSGGIRKFPLEELEGIHTAKPRGERETNDAAILANYCGVDPDTAIVTVRHLPKQEAHTYVGHLPLVDHVVIVPLPEQQA